MACLIVNEAGQYQITQDTLETCTGYVLVTVTEYKLQAGALTHFDQALANDTTGFMLLTFFTGHAVGRLVKWLGSRR